MIKKDIKKLNNLLVNLKCPNNYYCVNAMVEAPQVAKVYADANLLDCLGCDSGICKYIKNYQSMSICECPLRKLVAKNYDILYSSRLE